MRFPTTEASNGRWFLLLLFVAYLSVFGIRLIWVYNFAGNEAYSWNGQLMINTNDGYYFAEVARDLLAGRDVHWAEYNGAVAVPTVWLTKLLPIPFETLILYMPALFGSLLIVPLLLLGTTLRQMNAGFIGALIAGVAWSYYNRTMIGYYDSDMLNIVLPMMVLWSLVYAIDQQKNRYLLLVMALLILSQWWYPKNVALNSAMVVMALVYSFVHDRRNLFNYKLLTFALIGLAFVPVYVKLLLGGILFSVFHLRREWDRLSVLPATVAAAVVYLFSGAFESIWASFSLYVVNRLFADALPQLIYYDVINTVREAGAIPFETFANRISGSIAGFLFATIGVIVLMIRYPVMIIGLPMVLMGFMAYKAGLRFTIYAVPIYALGAGYLSVLLATWVRSLVEPAVANKAFYIVICLTGLALLYPNIQHAREYLVPSVFYKNEVLILDQLNKVAKRDDYVVSWWDYGYPIRYYADVNTLVDGGRHTGQLNYPVSLALSANQTVSANIARLDVENAAVGRQGMRYYLKDYGTDDPEDFLTLLDDKNFELPKKSREIYYYLPIRMLDIFQTVDVFSNIDLKTGQLKQRRLLYQTEHFRDTGETLDFGNGVVLNKKNSVLHLGQDDVPIRRFVDVGHDTTGRSVPKIQNIRFDGPLSILYLRDYHRMVILDETFYNSTFVQLGLLELYDPELFEPVVANPMAKVYRLKR